MKKTLEELKFLLPKKRFYQLILLIIAMTFSAFLELLGVGILPVFITAFLDFNILNDYLFKFGITFFSDKSQLETLQILIFVILSLFIFKNFFLITIHYFENHFSIHLVIDNSKRLFSHYLFNDYSFHVEKNSSKLINNVTNEVEMGVAYVTNLLSLSRELLICIFIFFLLAFNSNLNSISMILALLLIMFFFYISLRKTIRKKGKISQDTRRTYFFYVHQTLDFIKEIIVLNKRNIFFNIFDKNLNISNKQRIFKNTLVKMPRIFLEMLVIIILVSLVYYSFNFMDQNLILPTLSLYTVSLIRLIPVYSSITVASLNMKYHSVSLELVANEIKNSISLKKNFILEEEKFNSDFKKVEQLEIKDLYFKYNKSKDFYILRKINFNIQKGQTVGIIGRSGSGKTTLGDLIMGLYEPSSGKILCNNKNIYSSINQWQKLISYVPQDVFMLDDTIKNNIAVEIDAKKINLDKLNKAVELSNISEFVDNFNDGLDTKVGERGVKLSGGQKQRIGIARALYREPQILLLDEATSALDEVNEEKIISSLLLLKKNVTVILITHKKSCMKICEKIINVENGEIKKIGTYDEVIKSL